MAEVSTRTYAGISKEERIKRRRILLIETAIVISNEMSWWNLSVDRLCHDAHLNKRYFYESFSDLDELACAVVDHVANEATMKISSKIITGQSISEMAHSTIDTFVRFITDVPCRAKLIFGELILSDTLIKHRKRVIHGILQEITRHARQIHNTDVQDSIIETTAIFLLGGTSQAILQWLDAEDKISIEQLINNLTTLWLITGNGAAEYALQQ